MPANVHHSHSTLQTVSAGQRRNCHLVIPKLIAADTSHNAALRPCPYHTKLRGNRPTSRSSRLRNQPTAALVEATTRLTIPTRTSTRNPSLTSKLFRFAPQMSTNAAMLSGRLHDNG